MKEQEHQVYIGNYPLREAPLLKYLIGKYFYIYAWVLPFIVLYAVPWGFLYDQEWYRSYMDFVRPVLPVLDKIHDSKIAFPEYAVAFLAFLNMFGLVVCSCGFLCILIFSRIDESHKMLSYSFVKIVVNVVFIFLIGSFFIPYSILTWDGRVAKGFELIFSHKELFIAIAILVWWGAFLLSNAAPVGLRIAVYKISKKPN